MSNKQYTITYNKTISKGRSSKDLLLATMEKDQRPAHTKRISKKRHISKKNKQAVVKRVGRWLMEEKKTFLKGLRIYGRGQWKAIAKLIPNR